MPEINLKTILRLILHYFPSFFPWALLLILLVGLFYWADKILLIISNIQRFFAGFSTSFSKQSIQNELKGRVLKASKIMHKEIDSVLPYDVKIEWVKNQSRESFIKNNNVIVCMDHKRTKDENVVYALNEYVANGLLPKARTYIDRYVLKSSQLVMTRKLLLLTYKKGLDYYLEHVLGKSLKEDPEIEELVGQLISLDEGGLFVQILLREILNQSKLVYGRAPNDLFKIEVKDLIQFLYGIAIRGAGEDSKLNYCTSYFKIAIILVANSITYNRFGDQAYIWRFDENLRKGVESVYLLARGTKKKAIAKQVAEELKNNRISIKNTKEFNYLGRYKDGKEYTGVCICFEIVSVGEESSIKPA